MGRYKVVESKRWFNATTGETASVYGAVPWTRDADASQWKVETVGWTVEDLETGRVGIGRQPWKEKQDAIDWAATENKRLIDLQVKATLRSFLEAIPLGEGEWFDRTEGEPVRVHRGYDATTDKLWFWVEGEPEQFTLIEMVAYLT